MARKVQAAGSLVSRDDCVLIVIDVQEKLMPVISGKKEVAENVIRLARFAGIAGIPVVITEQEKLGPTLPEVKKELAAVRPIPKVHFNCFSCKEFQDEISRIDRPTLILAGVEAHICVLQTALHGLGEYEVHVVSDAVSSRAPDNRKTALERMKQYGATITSTEMFIYEILRKAGTDEFRATLPLVK
ncbi:MAG: Vibriobactin-specific isochorismatase [Syntrophorhabdus sp. PtaU1.Bin058]|nr:MAG: Vibriobactin-specific isochorismatase [Syntrophorhabdus sp. PtaU1.Bin058]